MAFVKKRPFVEINVSDINCCRMKTKDGVDSPKNANGSKMLKRLLVLFSLCRRKEKKCDKNVTILSDSKSIKSTSSLPDKN